MDFQLALDEFLLYLQVEQNYSTNTVDSYESDLTKFIAFLEQHNRSTALQDITSSLVRRFIQQETLQGAMSPRTIQRRISSLRSLCHFCLKENFTSSNFMAGIKSPKSDTKLPVYMNLEEVKRLFSSLEREKGPLSLRNEAMFKLLATTGMRRQELVDLTWQHIDLYNETVLIFGKGNKERLLPLHSMMIPLLEKLKASLEEHQTHPLEPVFRNSHGKGINPRGVNMIFKEVLQKAGLPPHRFTLHHLRHTFASLLLQQGNVKTTDEKGIPHYLPTEKVDLRTLQEANSSGVFRR